MSDTRRELYIHLTNRQISQRQSWQRTPQWWRLSYSLPQKRPNCSPTSFQCTLNLAQYVFWINFVSPTMNCTRLVCPACLAHNPLSSSLPLPLFFRFFFFSFPPSFFTFSFFFLSPFLFLPFFYSFFLFCFYHRPPISPFSLHIFFRFLLFLPLSSLSFCFLFSFLGLLPGCTSLLY